MRRIWLTLLTTLVGCTFVSSGGPGPAATPSPSATRPSSSVAGVAHPFAQRTTLPGSRSEVTVGTVAERDAALLRAYRDWKRRYLVRAGRDSHGPLYRVAHGKPGTGEWAETVSEGQGYGMLILVLIADADRDARTLFDGLWRYARANPSRFDHRLMAWISPGAPEDRDAAFDGDADMAYALLLADTQWGSGGQINYRSEATTLIAAIKESMIGTTSRLPQLGDWVAHEEAASTYTEFSVRTSDFMPSHFTAFGRATADEAFWAGVNQAMADTVEALQSGYAPRTGLLPDFTTNDCSRGRPLPCPVPEDFLEAETDGEYNYNAARVPWRLGVSALLGDARAQAQVARAFTWVARATGGDPTRIRAGYLLDGRPAKDSDYLSTVFVAPFGVAGMAMPDQRGWVDKTYRTIVNVRDNYFEDTVSLICLLIMTGHYWPPA